MVRPDYQGGSIVNLMSSLIAALGGKPGVHPPLREHPIRSLATSTNVVLLVIDGLGHEFLMRHGRDTMLAANLLGRLTSVFPSTTATAITTFLTGEAPQQHAITGWHMYLRELGCVATVLPFKPRHGSSTFEGVDPAQLFGHVPVFDRIDVASHIISPDWIIDSEYNLAHSGAARRHGYSTMDQMFEMLASAVERAKVCQYVYAYWPELDRLAHEYGISSGEVAAHLRELDAAFAALLERIAGTNTTLIVTADHGFVDVSDDGRMNLTDYPDLAQDLWMPLCGESRVAWCYVRPGKFEDFAARVDEKLGHRAVLYDSGELVAQGWFGLGDAHPRLAERIGTHALLMADGCILKDWLPNERPYQHAGVHGGTSADEMYVPLIVATP
ncbi:MAG: alkaline phosphatase family protein [Pseudomonadota bacterium]|nr:MAG: alkaline phosphatase family protein [Pseudomonadota bacterium]